MLCINHPELYLSLIKFRRHRRALTRLRCSNHLLAIEKFRGRLPRQERLCKYCINNNVSVVEDEYHFVLVCPLYKEIRSSILKYDVQFPTIMHYVNLMSNVNEVTVQNLACYVYNAFKIHAGFHGYNIV